MEFVHIRRREIRIFCGSAEREQQIKNVLKKFAKLIKKIQAELK